MKINVLVADDHDAMREVICAVLGTEHDIRIVGRASNGTEAIEEVERLLPHVVLMDITMPGVDGLEATRQLAERCPGCRVVIMSVHSTAEHYQHAVRAGAWGYLPKESAIEEFAQAVRLVYEGRHFVSLALAERLEARLGPLP